MGVGKPRIFCMFPGSAHSTPARSLKARETGLSDLWGNP